MPISCRHEQGHSFNYLCARLAIIMQILLKSYMKEPFVHVSLACLGRITKDAALSAGPNTTFIGVAKDRSRDSPAIS